MQPRDAVYATAGVGLDGDRYALGIGVYSKPTDDGMRALTLIERESVAAVAAEIPLLEVETRRNVVTSNVALNYLVGRRFQIGDVVLIGLRLCEPCVHLERLTRAGIREALVHRGGLRAAILESGMLRVGDPVLALD